MSEYSIYSFVCVFPQRSYFEIHLCYCVYQYLILLLKIPIYLFDCSRSYLWHVVCSSLIRDQTQVPCIGRVEPLDRQGSPYSLFIYLFIYFYWWVVFHYGPPRWLSGKESACNVRNEGLIPGSGRSPGEGNGNPLQYSSLGNPMDRGAWWTTVHGVAELDMN